MCTINRGSDASQPALTNASTWTPLVDLQEESDRFVPRADVPGVELKDIEVSAEETLAIRGERLAREHVKRDGFEHIERVAGRFLRRFTLPDSARAEAIIKAHYADGALEIEIPEQQPRVEAKRISVTVN